MVPVRETAGRGGDGTENLSKVHRYPPAEDQSNIRKQKKEEELRAKQQRRCPLLLAAL